ncbi:MAG: START domain-containing protein [Cytophagaceae bacterium]
MKFSGIIIFSITAISFSFNSNPEWKLKKQADNISVYVRESNTAIKQVKVSAEISTNIKNVLDILDDKASYNEWIYSCSESYLVKKIKDNEVIHYQRIKTPWPAEDRDVVIKSSIIYDSLSGKAYVHAVGYPDGVKENPGVVRVKKYSANWEIQQIGQNLVKAEYILTADPGGAIPIWIINLAVAEGPYKSMENMKRILQKKNKR